MSDDYGAQTTRVHRPGQWVQIDLGEDADDPDHLISAEERFRVAMNRQ